MILGDFTGEGRADYMLVDKDSKVTGFINRLQPHSVAPRWSLPVTVAKGRDDIDINSVRMVDMNGDGKVDYIALGGKGKISYWRNKSSGGRSQPGEGVFLCDCKFPYLL